MVENIAARWVTWVWFLVAGGLQVHLEAKRCGERGQRFGQNSLIQFANLAMMEKG